MNPVILHIELDNQSIIEWIKNNKLVIYSEIVRYSEKLIRQNLKIVQALIIANLSENIVFIIKDTDVKFTLEKAMQYFLSIEEYEQCSKIQELFILIEKSKNKNEKGNNTTSKQDKK